MRSWMRFPHRVQLALGRQWRKPECLREDCNAIQTVIVVRCLMMVAGLICGGDMYGDDMFTRRVAWGNSGFATIKVRVRKRRMDEQLYRVLQVSRLERQ